MPQFKIEIIKCNNPRKNLNQQLLKTQSVPVTKKSQTNEPLFKNEDLLESVVVFQAPH